jgi:hypothetical protein
MGLVYRPIHLPFWDGPEIVISLLCGLGFSFLSNFADPYTRMYCISLLQINHVLISEAFYFKFELGPRYIHTYEFESSFPKFRQG